MYKLLNGVILPSVGVGTSELIGKLSAKEAEDLLVEFMKETEEPSLIDTASVYGTEELVGNAIRRAVNEGVPRENILLQTKIPNDMQGYEKTLQAFEESLNRLGVDFLDIYLIHWPIPRFHENDYKELNRATWKAMERLYKAGKIRAIGVSNFLPQHIENILSDAEVPPMVNQLEIHPWYQQAETVKYCQERNILVEAWGPFRKGRLFQSEEIGSLAEKYHATPDKITLAWLKRRGIMPIVKSSSLGRMLSNLLIPAIDFQPDDLEIIAALEDKEHGHADFWNYKRQLNSVKDGGSDMDNLFDISGKVVLVTGASSGIGASTAEMFASRVSPGGVL